MSEAQFLARVDRTLELVEEILDTAETDIDAETQGGMMTVKCENGSQIIFTRQPPLLQLWLATRTGGYHFDQSDSGWVRDSDGAPLDQVLQQAFAEQAGETFDFSPLRAV